MSITKPCSHVRLDASVSDDPIVVKLLLRLEKYGIKCCLSDDPFSLAKLLIYVTDDYIENSESACKQKTETTTSKLFQIKDYPVDTVIILRSNKLTKCIPQNLSGYITFDVSEEVVETDDVFLSRLIQAIHKECSAACSGRYAALSYFFGFLHLILPDFRQRLLNQTLATDKETAKVTAKKLLIILPESCFCPPKFPVEKFKHTDKFVVRMAARAGNDKRDYKSSLYRVHDDEKNTDYYFVGEFATPLLTMYEAFKAGWFSSENLKVMREAFFVALNEILSDPRNADCNQQYRLLLWRSDPESGSDRKVELYDYLLPVIKQELANEVTLVEDEPSCVEAGSSTENEQQKKTYEFVDVQGSNPAAVYDAMLHKTYDLDVGIGEVRGLCLIINIDTFKQGTGWEQRTGSAEDVDRVKILFESLKFKCDVSTNLTLSELEKVLVDVSGCDHSADKAFVLVFMSHGNLGVVYTSDVKAVAILHIAEYFNDANCPSLRGKPKMFFIQACARAPTARQPQTVTGDVTTTAPTSGDVAANNHNFSRQCSVPVMVTDADDTSCSGGGEVPSVEAGEGEAANEGGSTNPAGETVEDKDAAKSPSGGGPDTCISSPAVEGAASPSAPEDETSQLQCDANEPPALREVDGGALMGNSGHAVLVPSWPDYVMSYATLPGAAAFRVKRMKGALYVNCLCKHLLAGHEIDRALKLVTESVSNELPKHAPNENQRPFHLATTQKLIYL